MVAKLTRFASSVSTSKLKPRPNSCLMCHCTFTGLILSGMKEGLCWCCFLLSIQLMSIGTTSSGFVCIFVSLLGKGLFDTKSLCSCIIDTWEENTKVYLFYYLSNQVLNKVFSYF